MLYDVIKNKIPSGEIKHEINKLSMKSTDTYLTRELHVSDYDIVDEKHWLPGEGEVDWEMVCNSLI